MAVIYLIRHGQAAFSSADYDQLTPLGEEQSRVLGAAMRLRVPKPDHVVSGGMKRHRQTAAAYLQAMSLDPACECDDGFNEYDHEDIIDRHMDRRVMVEVVKAAPDRRRAFEQLFTQAMRRWQSGTCDADYRETWSTFRGRCLAALERVCARLQSGQSALVFTSGGVISVVAEQLLCTSPAEYAALNWRLVNAGITKLVYGSGGLSLATLNEHGYFEGVNSRLLTYR